MDRILKKESAETSNSVCILPESTEQCNKDEGKYGDDKEELMSQHARARYKFKVLIT